MAELRGRHGLPVDDSFQLREYPTLGHVIGYISSFGDASTHVVQSKLAEIESEAPPLDNPVVESTNDEEKK